MGKLAAKGTPGVQYTKLDVQKYGTVAQQFGVRSIPDTRVFHNGKQVAAFVGSKNGKAIEKILAPHRSKLVASETTSGAENGNVLPQAIQPAGRTQLPPGIRAIPAS